MYGEGSLVSIVGGVTGGPARVILVLRECIWNAPEVSLVLPAFDVTGSLGFSSTSGGLSPWLHPGELPSISLRGIERLS